MFFGLQRFEHLEEISMPFSRVDLLNIIGCVRLKLILSGSTNWVKHCDQQARTFNNTIKKFMQTRSTRLRYFSSWENEIQPTALRNILLTPLSHFGHLGRWSLHIGIIKHKTKIEKQQIRMMLKFGQTAYIGYFYTQALPMRYYYELQ